MNFQDLRIVVGHIKKGLPCPSCSAKYQDEDIDIIGSLGPDHFFILASCISCEMEAMVHVTLNWENKGGVLPTFQQLGTAPRGGQILPNEILDIHNFLKEFEGDFKSLFK